MADFHHNNRTLFHGLRLRQKHHFHQFRRTAGKDTDPVLIFVAVDRPAEVGTHSSLFRQDRGLIPLLFRQILADPDFLQTRHIRIDRPDHFRLTLNIQLTIHTQTGTEIITQNSDRITHNISLHFLCKFNRLWIKIHAPAGKSSVKRKKRTKNPLSTGESGF